ncbi:MAG: Hsp20/alpha crystallin family protein [Bryobacteraceae bacterium]|jgi:HSP20 family protein
MHERKQLWPLFPAESEPGWKPLADVGRTRRGWLLKFDLAGVGLEDVTVSVRGRQVSVVGQRRDSIVEEGFSHYSMEISYSRFERTIEMPCNLENARVTLEARDGFLLVRIGE